MSERKQLTDRRPSAICCRGVGRAYAPVDCIPGTGLASLRSRGYGWEAAEPAAACGRSVFVVSSRHLPRLRLSTGRNLRRCGLTVPGSTGWLRRRSSLGHRAELPVGLGPRRRPKRCYRRLARGETARFDRTLARGETARFDRTLARGETARFDSFPRARRTLARGEVCLGRRAARGAQWDPQHHPAVADVFRPRSRGGSSECPLGLGRRQRAIGPRGTAPKTGRSGTCRIGGGPGTTRDASADGLAEMTRTFWRSGSRRSLPSPRVARDLLAALSSRSVLPRAPHDQIVGSRLPPTHSRAALSSRHAQHVGHQCRYR
jgi:hypothetical protein